MRMDENLLGEYLKVLRKESEVSAKELSSGLCSAKQLYAAEGEKRTLEKLTMDVILERLGIGAEDYEHFLDAPDYARWEDRQHILHAITFEEFESAGERLNEYYAAYCSEIPADAGSATVEEKLELQFYLCMRTLLKSCTGCGREELRKGYLQALELTVPDLEQRPLAGRMLSLKELNLILEAERHRADEGRTERYEEIVSYIETSRFDKIGRAKIYPKAVYFLCRKAVSGKAAPHKAERQNAALDHRTVEKDIDSRQNADGNFTEACLLQYCRKAYESLRNGGRMCFLWEILSMREFLLESLIGQWSDDGNVQKGGRLRPMLEENRKFRLILERLYQEFGVRRETFEFCYLYVMKETYCVNDMIRIRRRMLGVKAETLCRGICTVRTLRNIENKKTTPQRAVADELLKRLGLPKNQIKTEIVTDDPRARELESRLRNEINDSEYDKADRLLKELKARISAEIPCNRQLLEKQGTVIDMHQGRITKEEYKTRARKALEITLPFKAFLREGAKYLTNLEQACIMNVMGGMDEESEEFRICMRRFEEMYQPLIQAGMQETVANMYELVMGTVGSQLGDWGEYDRSDEIDETIIKGCLRFRRVGNLHDSLYGRWWNHNEREKKGIPTKNMLNPVEELERCIRFAEFSHENDDIRFYERKLQECKDMEQR